MLQPRNLNFFCIFVEKEVNARVHVLRTESGGIHQNVDLFCKETGVSRQRSEARNQASNGMRRKIINMARCMIFASGLPPNFWGDAVEYVAYNLNCAPTSANLGGASSIKVLTQQTPSLGEIVVFGYKYMVYRDPRKQKLSQAFFSSRTNSLFLEIPSLFITSFDTIKPCEIQM